MKAVRSFPAILLLALFAAPAAADGFHSPLLRNRDPRRWAETVREELGLDRTDSAEETRPAGPRVARGRAGQLVQVLKYLDRRNVLLREFPDFNYDAIPAFKSETEALLIAIGRDAAPLLVATLVNDLKNAGPTIEGLRKSDDFIDRVLVILAAIGEDAVPEIVAWLADEHPRVRATLTKLLGRIVGEPDFGESASAWRRWYRIWKAGRDRDAGAADDLLAALDDADPRLRLAAVRALGRIGGEVGAPRLRRLLAESKHPAILAEAMKALVKMRDLESAPLLIDFLDSPRVALREVAATALRFLAARSFGYDARAPTEERAAAAKRWRSWWRDR